jgi:hypothetical protein
MTDGISFEVKGLDEAKRHLEQLKHKSEALSGEHLIPLKDLFTSDFLTKHTDFNSLDAMFHTSDFTIESEEDLKKVPDDKWDDFISKHTRFPNWKEMQGKAAEEYFLRKLGL